MGYCRKKWSFGSLGFIGLIFCWFASFVWLLWPLTLDDPKVSVIRWILPQGESTVLVGPSEKDQWVSLEKVSRVFVYSLLAAEDSRFFQHYGLDFDEIKESYLANKKAGRIVRGGSTISQQVVKMIFLSHEKTWRRKIYEMTGALVLEQLLSKDEILSWYINLVSFGVGVYGLKDAASIFFQTQPEFLTLVQSIHLVLLIPSPNIRSKMLKERKLDEQQKKRFILLLQELLNTGLITKVQFSEALATGDFGNPLIDKN